MASIDARNDDEGAWTSVCKVLRSWGLTPGGNWQEMPRMRAVILRHYSSDTLLSLERACSEYDVGEDVRQQLGDGHAYRCSCCCTVVRNWRYARNRVNGNVLRLSRRCYDTVYEMTERYGVSTSSVVGSPLPVYSAFAAVPPSPFPRVQVVPTPVVVETPPPPVSLPVASAFGWGSRAPVSVAPARVEVPVVPTPLPAVEAPSAPGTPTPASTPLIHLASERESLLREDARGCRLARRCTRRRGKGTSALERMRVSTVRRAEAARDRARSGRREVYLRCIGGAKSTLVQMDSAIEVLVRARAALADTVREMPGLE
jgi:hypothetical protein